jgi:lactoylglutathione lyase
MTPFKKPLAIGLNHIALEVGDIDDALVFYGRILDFELRGRNEGMAFVQPGGFRTRRRRQANRGPRHRESQRENVARLFFRLLRSLG